MDNPATMMLYTLEPNPVIFVMKKDGAAYTSFDFVRRKYEESGHIFLTAYRWFTGVAEKYVKRPPKAEVPYMIYHDPINIEIFPDSGVMELEVPLESAIFFDALDLTRILQMRYLGETPEEEREYREKLRAMGITRESDVVLTDFYPQLKKEVLASWDRLFRHNDLIKSGNFPAPSNIQAAVWELRYEWVRGIKQIGPE